MFDDLQKMFRESVAAFRRELNRQEPEDQLATLLDSMRREWVAGRAELSSLTDGIQRIQSELTSERQLLQQCERRGKLAHDIGDEETVRIASEFANRHRERAGVLEQKLTAAEAERELRAREVEDMKRKYQEADANRHVLLANLRRAANQARRQSVADEVGESFEDWERMREKIEQSGSYAEALEDLESSLNSNEPPQRRPADVEDRLRELKRKLGKDE